MPAPFEKLRTQQGGPGQASTQDATGQVVFETPVKLYKNIINPITQRENMSKKTMLAYSMLLASLVSQNANCGIFREMNWKIQKMEAAVNNEMRVIDTYGYRAANQDKGSMTIALEQREMEIRRNLRGMEIRSNLEKIQKEQGEMRSKLNKVLSEDIPEEAFIKHKNIDISQKDTKIIITIDLGKNIEKFDTKTKTESNTCKKDQIIIEVQNPQQQIIISTTENFLTLEENKQIKTITRKKIPKPFDTEFSINSETLILNSNKLEEIKPGVERYEESYQSSSSTKEYILEKKLDIENTDLEYDEKTGILTVVIPHAKALRHGTKVPAQDDRDQTEKENHLKK